MPSFKSLFTPLQIGSHVINNRIGMSALTRNRAPHTFPTDIMKQYYVQRAVGGAGLIVSEGILITRQGTEWLNAPGIWDEKHVHGWKKITDAVHEAGTRIYAQLWHLGRVSHPDSPEQKLAGVPVYGPSAIAARGGKFRFLSGEPGYTTPTAIDDPWKFVAIYKQAAINAKEAGFDGVELHGANGYLITQFLDTNSNHRTDQWGGSIENRSRLGLEVLKVLIEVFGKDVSIKLSPAGGYNDVGMPLQDTLDTYNYFISESDKLGLSYITLMQYAPKFDISYPGVPGGRATKMDVLSAFRPVIKNAKLFLNVDVTPEQGASLIEEGKIDGIMIGLNWITHPDYAKRVLHGKKLDNVPNWQTTSLNVSEDDWSTGLTDYPAAVYDD